MTWHAGELLARRIEHAEAVNSAACAEGHTGFAVEWFGAGCAVFAGASSPLTHAVGVGMDAVPVRGYLERIEEFFLRRGALPVIELCPLADPGFVQEIGDTGYRLTEFNNMLVRKLDEAPPPAALEVREALPDEENTWSRILAQGFLEREEITPDELLVAQVLFRMSVSRCYWALMDGQPVAAAAMSVHQGVALLFADGTPAGWRRRGAQQALVAARLERARAEGCDLAAASTLPGSGSQRNYERMGFRTCYTKVVLTADRPTRSTLI